LDGVSELLELLLGLWKYLLSYHLEACIW